MNRPKVLPLNAPRTPAPVAPRPVAERGRMLFVADVLELLQGKKSRWWVENRFAPEYKRKLGRNSYWWYADAIAWLDQAAA